MNLWKKEHQLPKIKNMRYYFATRIVHKQKASIELVTGLFFVMILVVFLFAQMQILMFRNTSLYLEDALAASNLASAIIDIETFGISHTIQIADAKEAYERYKEAVKANLQLDNDWRCKNESMIGGKVEISNYTIYNVTEDKTWIYRVDHQGRVTQEQRRTGVVSAPNGQLVEHTGIYSEIAYPVKGLFDITFPAKKGKLIDIVLEEEN